MLVTVEPTPDPEVGVTFQVDELGINETATTSAGVATFSIGVVTASNNSLWDATIQIGANMRAAATAQAVETNGATSIGVTVSGGQVTYCAPTGGGTGTGTVTSVTGTAPINVASGTSTPVVSLEDVSPTSAGAFTNADITVDAKGRVTVAATGSTQASSLLGPVLFDAKNDTGVTITKGSVVYIDGISGNTPTVALADANDAAKMPAFGLAYADLAAAATGSIITFGDITNVDTDGFVLDNPLYVSTTPGVLTQTKPAGETSLIQNIGLVTRVQQSSGRIKVTGAGRSNDTPNLDDGNIFIGNASNQVTTAALSTLTGVTSVTGTAPISVTTGATPVVSHDTALANSGLYNYIFQLGTDVYGHITSIIGQDAATFRSGLGLKDSATTEMGTTAGKIVQLDAVTAKLPAVDGSQLTNLPGGGSTDWKWDPESTTYIRIFDDFFGQGTDDVTGYDSGSATRFAAMTRSGGFWKSWISNDTFENTGFDLRGFIRSETDTSTSGRCLWTVPQCVNNSPSDGDEAMIEVNIKPTVDVAGSSTAQWWISIFRNDNNQSGTTTESSMNYGDLAKFGLAAEGANTNWFSYSYDNAGTAGSPTETDLGASYPISETTFTRVGLHYKYVSASTKYVCKAFINGTQVATFDITTGTGAPYIQGGIYNNSTGAVHSCLWDYAVLQYTAPTVTWKNITAV